MQAWPFCAGVLARSVGGEGRLVKEDFPSTSVSSSAGFPRTESGEQSWPLVGGRPCRRRLSGSSAKQQISLAQESNRSCPLAAVVCVCGPQGPQTPQSGNAMAKIVSKGVRQCTCCKGMIY